MVFKIKMDTIFLTCVIASLCHLSRSDFKRVTTNIGDIIGIKKQSSFSENDRYTWTYLGIPYGEAPVGSLRFKKPIPRKPFGVHNASAFGPACPQDATMMQQWIPGEPYMDEDCLSLNIYTPEPTTDKPSPAEGYPVMVWLHGGAYVIGQSSLYQGENLAAFGDVIVVSVNYRIGPFGFLATEDVTSKGNYGLWDQQLALKWIRKHIPRFGGNGHSITLFGESAGAASTVFQSLYPGNTGLFKRIIAQSGSAYSAWAFQDKQNAISNSRKLASRLNCSGGSDAAMINCLQSKPYKDIIANMRVGSQLETVFRPEFTPVLDHEFILSPPNDEFGAVENMPEDSKRMFASVDVLTGVVSGDGGFIANVGLRPYLEKKANESSISFLDSFNKYIIPLSLADRFGTSSYDINEMAAFVYREWQNPTTNITYLEELMDLSSDINFFIPSLFTALAHAGYVGGNNTYLFQFSHHSSYLPVSDWIPGCGHGDEIPYVFGFPQGTTMHNAYGYTDSVPETERRISANTMTYWTNFAKTGNPNMPNNLLNDSAKLVLWQKYDITHRHFIDIDVKNTIGQRLYAEREELWLHLAPRVLHYAGQLHHTGHVETINNNPLSGLIIG